MKEEITEKLKYYIEKQGYDKYFTKDRLKEYLSLLPLGAKALFYNLKNQDSATTRYFYFGEHESQYFVYFEPKANVKSRKTVFFIHGGGWQYGKPEDFFFIGYYFAMSGIPCVISSYRKAPDFVYPAMEQDIFKSFSYLINESGVLEPDTKIITAGQSSGAHLAALLNFKKHKYKDFNINGDIINGFISIAGPLDLSIAKENYEKEKIEAVLGSMENLYQANPINFLNGDEKIKSLFIHGKNDPVVDVKHTINFFKKMKNKNLIDLHILDDFLHSNTADLFLDKVNEVNIAKWVSELYK